MVNAEQPIKHTQSNTVDTELKAKAVSNVCNQLQMK